MEAIHVTVRRETKYTQAVREIMARLRHATNLEIASELRRAYPRVSDTTVHRVTQRLSRDGELAHAPLARDGSLRYDANIDPHDHFMCVQCQSLRDMQVPQACRALIQHQLGGCRVNGSLTIVGNCHHCNES